MQMIVLEKQNRLVLIIILGLLSAVAPFSIDMYLPGFPAIATDLNTTVDRVSYSLASFFVGVCVGQLVCGPLLDRFGRKRPLFIGLLLYIAASVGCALSPSIETLIAFRFLQALGGCVGMVAPRAIVRDIFPLHENAKILSLLILVLGISPILAPTIGSYVIATFGWNYLFLLLAVLATVLLGAILLWLPESKVPDTSFSLRLGPISSSYLGVLKEPQFYTYALAGGVSSAGLFGYLSGSPFVFMTYYGVSEQHYGAIFAFIAMGLISSSQLNNLLLKKYTSVQLMRSILLIQMVLGFLLVLGCQFDVLGLYGTVFLIFLFLSCQGFCFPNSAALSMAPFSREAGSASALLGALQMGLGSLAAAIVGLLKAESPVPMATVMASCTVLSVGIVVIGERKMKAE
jgi:DHA1 family bicyclomycin/chloramphenicol resistance-like MFS transporter